MPASNPLIPDVPVIISHQPHGPCLPPNPDVPDLTSSLTPGCMLRVRTTLPTARRTSRQGLGLTSPRSHPTSPTADELRKRAIKQSPHLVVCRICEMQACPHILAGFAGAWGLVVQGCSRPEPSMQTPCVC